MKRAIIAGVCCLLVGGWALAQEVVRVSYDGVPLSFVLADYAKTTGKRVERVEGLNVTLTFTAGSLTSDEYARLIEAKLRESGVGLFPIASNRVVATWINPPVASAPRVNPPAALAPAVEGSYAERLKARREERERRNAALTAASTNSAPPGKEELEKRLREYNLNLIRAKGGAGPPLPIPLTTDEDKQLVTEGVLPARP